MVIYNWSDVGGGGGDSDSGVSDSGGGGGFAGLVWGELFRKFVSW